MNDINAIYDELNDRLVAAEARVWGLTQLLRAFIRLEIVPKDAATKQIREMRGLMNPDDPALDEMAKVFAEVSRKLLDDLIAEADPKPPKLSVIDGGKNDKTS